jgi:hypothetical protein
MNDAAHSLANDYDKARQVGKKEISRSWQRLRPETRAWFVKSGHYTDRGALTHVEFTNSDVEELEYNLGLINRCVDAKLPQRSEKGAPIPPEASSNEVQSALSSLIYLHCGQDPVFLRRALLALQRYEMARLLCILPVEKTLSSSRNIGTALFAVFCFVLMLAAPAILASALVSIAHGNYEDTAAALYALGFIAWMLNIARGLGKDGVGTKDEQAYLAWSGMNPYQSGDWTAAGPGALAYFEEMMRKGLNVPAIAFDICESLKANTLR